MDEDPHASSERPPTTGAPVTANASPEPVGSVVGDRRDARSGWSRHDFRLKSIQPASLELSGLEEGHERFAARASATLSALLRQKIEIRSKGVSISKYLDRGKAR